MADQQKVGNITVGGAGTNPLVATRNLALASSRHAAKINTLVESLYPHNVSGKGGVSTSAADPRYTLPVVFASEPGVTPALTGLDGTSLYTFAGNDLVGTVPRYQTLHPVFYKTDNIDPNKTRPHTIYETFVATLAWFESQVANLNLTITGSASCITDCGYTKGVIGEGAFTPGAPLTPGSMLENIDKSLCYITQLREDILGESYTFRSYGSGDCTGKGTCSLNEKVDALLLLHGGAAYISGESSTGCAITLTDDGEAGCPDKIVKDFPVDAGEKFFLSAAGVISTLPNNQYAQVSVGALNDLYTDGREADPFSSEAPYVPLWLFDSGTSAALNVVSRWTWNINGAHRAVDNVTPIADDAWDEDTDRHNIRLTTPFNLNVLYDWEHTVDTTIAFDNNAEMYQFFEIALYGKIDGASQNPTTVVAKYSGTLGDLSALTFTPVTDADTATNPEAQFSPGPVKVCLLKDITFGDFDWNPSFLSYNFEHSSTGTATEIDGTKLAYAVITLVHKGGKDLETTHSGTGDAGVETTWGTFKLIGAEVEYFDDGCEPSDSLDPSTSPVLLSVTFTDGSKSDTETSNAEDAGPQISVTFTDGSKLDTETADSLFV